MYGGRESGKYALALQLLQDNPFLGEPVLLEDPAAMKKFLATPRANMGIVVSSSVQLIMNKSSDEKFGSVLFIPAPGEIEEPALIIS